MTRRRVENRDGSLGYPGFVKPVFTKDTKPLGKKEKIPGAPRDCDTRTHLKKELSGHSHELMSSVVKSQVPVLMQLKTLNAEGLMNVKYVVAQRFCFEMVYGDRIDSCQVIYSQFGLAIHQNDHQARRRFVEWAQNVIAVVPDFHKRILFSDKAHFWLNGYVNKQNCRIWSEANPQVYVETPLHPEKLTVWCALWAGGILLRKR
ncbi:hypothetical protein TNCV_3043601 [Trichonephila clavipes]|nr:hypothetical protein TNCV_3043601 [Trichonephila clavipes]